MLLSSRRDRAAGDSEAAERQRSVRERLEATVSGLGELDYLRQRQEVLVRAALELREEWEEEERQREAQLSSEEKLLEENILLLRKQLNCLRRKDAGLISQLQELDRQISDLQLDTETSHDPLETDSRPSSGFYELSDGASVSLSNSSNSVFSECFCPMAEVDGRLMSADELASCLECDGLVGGLEDWSWSGTVRRSASAPHPSSLDPISSLDSQSKFNCDVVARNHSDMYRYPSPLHAVVVQSPVLLQVLSPGGSGRDGAEGLKPESLSAPLVSQSSSWPASSSSKRLDGYIYSLLQRRALPIRTSRPRTSILRQASLCVRQLLGSGLGTLKGSEVKPSWPAGGAPASSSPQRKCSVDSRPEETQDVFPDGRNQTSCPLSPGSPVDINKKLLPPSAASKEASSSPKDTKQSCDLPNQEVLLKSSPVIKTPPSTPPTSLKPPLPVQTLRTGRSVTDHAGPGSSCQSPDGAGGHGGGYHGYHTVDSKQIPAQQQSVKLCKGGDKDVKTVKRKTTMTMKASRTSEHREPPSDRRGHRSRSTKKSRQEDKVSKRAACGGHGTSPSRIKCLPVSILDGRVLDKHTPSTLSSVRSSRHRHHGNHHHHHHHGRDQVVVVGKPKYKRNDYRRLRAIMEVPYDEAFRHAQRRQRKELSSQSAPPAEQVCGPYSHLAGSDSENSAECASLFHSTVTDTSEDERSDYTTNCFGDSESGEDAEETTTSDTEESGGGGAGRGVAGQEVTPAQTKAFVKIKASHTLKKKILRFRSSSLKLMTTM